MSQLTKIQNAMKNKKPKRSTNIPGKDFVSTGSAVLNCCCSGRATGGLPKGIMYLYAGDSSSGKTWLGMSVLAEASINPEFDDYDLIVDPTENGVNMNVERYFGPRLAERIEPLIGTKNDPSCSQSLEEFYDAYEERLRSGRPSITLLDSMDALRPIAQIRQEEKEAKARKKAEETKGSYGVDKAKINSARLRTINNLLKETKSIFIMIAQSRQTIGFAARFNPKTFSGGDAMRFYPRIILWTSVKGRETKKVRDVTRTIGQITQVKITKNHISGWEGKIELPFLKGVGIDDLGSCIDFLTQNKHWPQSKAGINAKEFEVTLKKEALVKFIEGRDLEKDLHKIVARVWHEIEAESTVQRKSRYE